MTAAPRDAVPVVGEEHLAHAERVGQVQSVERAVENVHPLEVEGDRHLSRRTGGAHLRDAAREGVSVRRLEPSPERGEHPDGVRPALHVVADIDGEEVDPRLLPDHEVPEIRGRPRLEAGMGVPDEGIGVERLSVVLGGAPRIRVPDFTPTGLSHGRRLRPRAGRRRASPGV